MYDTKAIMHKRPIKFCYNTTFANNRFKKMML
jgi:hypothetical protein